MFRKVDIEEELVTMRSRSQKGEELLISEANRILHNDLFTEAKILGNLRSYNLSKETLDEELLDPGTIFSSAEIRKIAVIYRMKFLDSACYKREIPYVAILKIKELEKKYHKDLKHYRILAPAEVFSSREDGQCLLFAKTNHDNFCLIHHWGKKMGWLRKVICWPLRRFETLALSVILFTLAITLILPTRLITLDASATYWSGYRIGTFFHLLIFDLGVTVYFTFTFALNFSSSVWNKVKNFG